MKHLLVDGWNLAFARAAGRTRRLEAEAQQLVADLRSVADADGWKVTVVFDANGAGLKRTQAAHSSVEVLLAPASKTADSVIEAIVAAAQPGTCVVVTADQAERSTVAAAGAELMTPTDLQDWLQRIEERSRRRISRVGSSGPLAKLEDLKVLDNLLKDGRKG